MFEKFKQKPQTVMYLPVSEILPSPYRSRSLFNGFEISALAESIKQNGLIEPVTVRKTDQNKFELVCGERRLRACILNGAKRIRAVCINATDSSAALISLAENLHRKDLHFFEVSRAINNILKTTEITRTELSKSLNLSQSAVSNKLRLLSFSAKEQTEIINSGLTERHARAIVSLQQSRRRELLDIIISKKLTVAETENLVNGILNPKPQQKRQVLTGELKLFQNSITKLVSSLCRSGVKAVQTKSETDEYIEYTVRIPKQNRIVPFSKLT